MKTAKLSTALKTAKSFLGREASGMVFFKMCGQRKRFGRAARKRESDPE
jgi:hypothetical protein